ncbi:MAG: RNA polymerase sigma factor [Planctomycetota bacterium]|nr:MAG: RNA polymerase sigma factor [Planctomycetota bacterium]
MQGARSFREPFRGGARRIEWTMTTETARAIDELLVVRCQAGESEAFTLLVRRWQRRLWQYARRLTGYPEAAWDVTQETWLVVLRRIRSLNDPAWFAAWAHRIVRNKCADRGRKIERRRRLVSRVVQRPCESADAASDSRSESLAAALRRLARNQREILLLKYGHDLTIVELSFVLGVPAGTVKSRLHHAREELRRALQGERS